METVKHIQNPYVGKNKDACVLHRLVYKNTNVIYNIVLVH